MRERNNTKLKLVDGDFGYCKSSGITEQIGSWRCSQINSFVLNLFSFQQERRRICQI